MASKEEIKARIPLYRSFQCHICTKNAKSQGQIQFKSTESDCTGIFYENIFFYGLIGIEDVKHISICLVRSNLLGYEQMKNC